MTAAKRYIHCLVILSEAKDLMRLEIRSFASLRMTTKEKTLGELCVRYGLKNYSPPS